MSVSVSMQPKVGVLPDDEEMYEPEDGPKKPWSCVFGFHDWTGSVLYMRCGCCWNRCLKCHKPQSKADKHVRDLHEHNHVK